MLHAEVVGREFGDRIEDAGEEGRLGLGLKKGVGGAFVAEGRKRAGGHAGTAQRARTVTRIDEGAVGDGGEQPDAAIERLGQRASFGFAKEVRAADGAEEEEITREEGERREWARAAPARRGARQAGS
jgi:hypothetical protein